jgi:hypothetical protein
MRMAKSYLRNCLASVGVLLALSLSMLSQAAAQIAPGDNTVYSSSLTPTNSHSFIDASVLNTSGDICAKINTALNNLLGTTNYPAQAGVIDARGAATGTCASSPWIGFNSTKQPPPAVILLPAGTITIPGTWYVPDRTRIIGEGLQTVVQAAGTGFTGTAMIQMGETAGGYTCPGTPSICFGIGIQDLRLDGSLVTSLLNGIVNDAAQELSYVNHVDLFQISGIGLLVGATSGGIGTTVTGNSGAQNSGPYANIRFDNSSNATSGTVCAQILGSTTRGIHGLTCTASTIAKAAILLDALGTTIEDVNITGFVDGVLIGANSLSTGIFENSNVLLNIMGAPGTNLIHICSPTTPTGNCINSSGGKPVTDLSILAVTNTNTSTTTTILDEEGGAKLTVAMGDSHVGAYILGEAVPITSSVSAYSRFSTSPRTPTWASANIGSAGITGNACNSIGSLFSNTTGSGTGNTLWACVGPAATATWKNIK